MLKPIKRMLSALSATAGKEGSPIHPRQKCQSCGGSGEIEVKGKKQKCTACEGTGYNPAA
jgi:DnaJ-class molecular chaperone